MAPSRHTPRTDTALRVVLALLFAATGCSQVKTTSMDWVRVETDNLIIRTDVRQDRAVQLAQKWQSLRDAIADDDLQCAFERTNAPIELVLLKDPGAVESLSRAYTSGATLTPPSDRLHTNTQHVIDYRQAARNTQLFAHKLIHSATAICFPGAGPWLHEGVASFYETARVRDGRLILGMPPYGFVEMHDTEPMHEVYMVTANNTEVWMLPLRLAPDFDELRVMDADQFYFYGKRRSVQEHQATTAHYAGSWNAVHLLQLGDRDLRESFQTYLMKLNQGEEDDDAWEGAFSGVDFTARYKQHLRSEYTMVAREVTLPAPRQPTVHAMSQTDVGLMWARLVGWSNEADREKAEAFVDAAEANAPDSSIVMLHRAALEYDAVGVDAGEAWLERALATDPENPTVLATAILWYNRKSTREARRGDLDAWAAALAPRAQTAFEFREYGGYLLLVAGDAQGALEPLNRSLMLDATSWTTYVLAGSALAELDRPDQAIQAYQTAVALTGQESAQLRSELKEIIAELRHEVDAAGESSP